MPPTYQNNLVLATTAVAHSGMVRESLVTYALEDPTDIHGAQAWADFLQDAFADAHKSQTDSQATIMRTSVLKGDGSSTPEVGISTAAGTAGTASASTLPPNCACLVKKVTGVGGRINRGRLYMPWYLTEADVDETGLIDPTAVSSRQTAMNDWKTAVEAEGPSDMIIANRVYDLPWTDPARVVTEVNIGASLIALTVENMLATQRRRMPR